MANDNPAGKSGDTTDRTATGFWSFLDEIKDGFFNLTKKYLPLGLGTVALIPLVFTKEGRSLVEELYHYARLQFGDQLATKAYKWSMRAFLQFRTATLIGFFLLLAAGMVVVLKFAPLDQIGDKAEKILPVVVLVFLAGIWYWVSLLPTVATIAAAAGALDGIKDVQLTLETLKSLPKFLVAGFSGALKSGVEWIDGTWRTIVRGAMFFTLASVWYTLAPLHNDPAMVRVSALAIPLLLGLHLGFKPPERGNFWWWVNWATVFFVADITVWCMFPVLRLVFDLGVSTAYLETLAPHYLALHQFFEQPNWWREIATGVALAVLVVEGAWTITLALSSGSAGQKLSSGRVLTQSSGAGLYAPAKGFAPNYQGLIALAIVMAAGVVIYIRFWKPGLLGAW